ncbi:MAG TPA: alpha-glucosidase C-terminal domain-containing protein, partial [Promineifilum sp.]|nr:alpha-glucosidase C-terminal domain-containing protein [Promineifilum sp.]
RHGCRTPMQWSSGQNAGFSEADKTYMPVIDDETYSYRYVNVTAQEADEDSYLAWTRYLINARQGQLALRSGTLSWVETGDRSVLAFRREAAGGSVTCVFNLSGEARPSGISPAVQMKDLLSRAPRIHPSGVEIQLQPYEALWLVEDAE